MHPRPRDDSDSANRETYVTPGVSIQSVPSRVPPADPVNGTVTVRARGLTWSLRPEWVSVITGDGAPNWTDLNNHPSAELIKCNPQRDVYRVRLGERAIYAKIYHPARWLDRVKNRRYGPKSRTEWRAGLFAIGCKLHTVLPVGCAVDAHDPAGAPSVLLTEELTGAVPLDEAWLGLVATDAKTRYRGTAALIAAAADLIASAHRVGFWHHDLHAANLLVQSPTDAEPRVAFVDLHSAQAGTPITEPRARRNLVQLNQWFARHATRTERLRFLKAYLARRQSPASTAPVPRDALDRWVGAIAVDAHRHANLLWAKRDRRSTRTGTYFTRLRLPGGWSGHAYVRCKRPVDGSRASRLVFSRSQWQSWLADPTRFFSPDRPEDVLKDSHSGTVVRAELPVDDGPPLPVICKRSRPRTWAKRLWYLFRPARPIQTFRRGHALLNRDLPTARPLVALQRRIAGLIVDGLVITEAIPDTEDLDALLRMRLLDQPPARQRRVKRQLIDELVRLYTRLHDRGCLHRDMKAPNLLVQWSADRDELPRITLVDLDGLHMRRRMTWPQRLRTIMRLNVSLDPCRIVTRTDRLRFLKAYLARSPHPSRQWKSVWKALTAASAEKRTQKAKRHAWKLDRYGRG